MAADHWLIKTARHASLEGAAAADITPQMTPAEAWDAVADACGITHEQLARHVASHYRVNLADLDSADPLALKLISEKLARRYHVFPLRESGSFLTIATTDPRDLDAEQALEFASGRMLIFQVAEPAAIRRAIDSGYSPDGMVEALLKRVEAGTEVADAVRVLDELEIEETSEAEATSTPVVKLTNLILRDAINQDASDIHVEPEGKGAMVRFRVDGVLRQYMQMPLPVLTRVISRIKILGRLDIADRLRPQDGRARVQVNDRLYDLRISTVPTRDSEKAVLRILKPQGPAHGIGELGLPEWEEERLRRLLSKRDGILLVTGPTGSGKTTTLYAALRELATGEVNIMTVEDPVEYDLDGATQIQVERQRGLTFASALRAILRQDPDSILVGEVRDGETADVAVQASLTGHLVLATLHTNSAIATVNRLKDLGLDRPSIAATLRGAMAQRLVRTPCTHCVEAVDGKLNDDEARLAEHYGVEPVVRAVGCKRCGQTGYRGRTPVLELMVVTPEMQELIARGASMPELARAAVAGEMRPMQTVALERVRNGVTTLQEVQRVLGDYSDDLVGQAQGLIAAANGEDPPVAAPQTTDARPDTDGSDRSIATDDGDLHRVRLVAAALDGAAHAAAITDRHGVVEWVNRAFTDLTGYSAEEAIGQELKELESGPQSGIVDWERWETAFAGEPWTGELQNRHRDGGGYTVEQVVTPVDTGKEIVEHFLVLQQDISRRKEWEQRVRKLAMHDSMTDLPNAFALEENLERAARRAERGQQSALLLIDIDGFERVNEALGRAAGDACVVELATLLRNTLRPGDLLARLGSDDFAALLEDAPIGGAYAAAARLQERMDRFEFTHGDRTVEPRISIGVAAVDAGLDAETITARAGSALRAAKSRGGAQVAVFKSPQEEGAGA